MSYGARMDGKQVVLGGLDTHKKDLMQIRNMLLTGCGTSKYAAEYGAKLFRDMDCFETVSVLDSAEVRSSASLSVSLSLCLSVSLSLSLSLYLSLCLCLSLDFSLCL
jgi:glucosamine 6-phosphate synthetase-like amidotransferase/phosphosugar isomerase protein